ncbi:BUD13 homolog isoform X2 [Anabrus simplex]|uniref:BUD13 homolog isoform X2 n=1 Tax=Anabrus simplex TaxID=316456 RepID=UPI0035A2B691
MATQGINQKEYLKKYLSSSSDDKKKKKKRNKGKSNDERFRIIDDDIDLKNMRPLEDGEIELYSLAEDAPQIAGIIDERPDELRTLEEFGTKRWKVVADENGIEDIKVTAINHSSKPNSDDSRSNCAKQRQCPDTSPVRKSRTRNSPSVSSSSSPPRRQKSDISPKDRDNSKVQKKPEVQTQDSRRRNIDDSSPRKIKKEPDSDESPPRKSRKQETPPRKMEKLNSMNSSPGGRSRRYDADESPPRKPKRQDVSKSPALKVKRENDSDESASRKPKQKRYDSDESPPRRTKRPDSNKSPPRRSKRDSDSDESPPRKYKRKDYSDESPPRKPQRLNESPQKLSRREDSDESPPRKPGRNEFDTQTKYSKSQTSSRSSHYNETSKRLDNHNHRKYNSSSVRRSRFTDIDSSTSKDVNRLGSSRGSDSDLSPSRKMQRPDSLKKNHISPHRESLRSSSGSGSKRDTKDYSISSKKHRNQSDSDESPPRKLGKHNDSSDARDNKSRSSRELTERTLDGRKAGLQDAKELRKEISEMKRNEREIFEKMDPSVSGKGAAPIVRDRKTGKRRDLEQEAKEKQEQDKKKAEHDSKYTKWGRGLKQVEEQAQRLQEDMYEMTKPLARYADDTDLDQHLREQEREGDPMLDYIRSKTSEPSSKKKPQYQGSFLPNRFGIRPGHRWDGVDRSSGYEKQWFETANAKKATEEEAYKWSTSDM